MKKLTILLLLAASLNNSLFAGFGWSSPANTDTTTITSTVALNTLAPLEATLPPVTTNSRPQVPRLDFSRIRALVDSQPTLRINTPALTKSENPVQTSASPAQPYFRTRKHMPINPAQKLPRFNVKRDRRNSFVSDRSHFKR